jgi:uncharacterized membrane protein YphA (DoxX/SURF4 family)
LLVPDLRRISTVAVVLLIGVRICIGWQFAYEGLWKLNSQHGAKPWTSAGYLKNAQGPFRSHFRNMTGDPDDLSWLDYEQVEDRWDAWHQRLRDLHSDLTKDQKMRINWLLNGRKEYVTELVQMPDGVKFGGSLAKVAHFNAQRKRLIVDGIRHLIPAERNAMLKLVRVVEQPAPEDVERNEIAKAYQKAVNEVYKKSSRLSIKEQAKVLLKGDPDRASQIYREHTGTIDYKRMGNIELYQKLLVRYERNLADAQTAFQYDHLQKQWADIQQMRADLVGPVKALDADLKAKTRKLLTATQLERGPVPEPWNRLAWIDQLTMWTLLTVGALLMAGLFSRASAVAAAVLLLSFYLAMPPWPGVSEFQQLPGPEHSFLIDKNLIEVFALLAIAAMPTGEWFGVDTLIRRLLQLRKTKQASPAEQKTVTAETKAEPAESTAG